MKNTVHLLVSLLVFAISGSRIYGQTGLPADTLFKAPYIDKDEWRDKPVRHHYVHGGFKGTDTRFSFYFPPNDQL